MFSVTCIIADPEIISYRNFLMCVKDINMTLPQTERYSTLTYATRYPERICLYKGGIAVPGDDTLFVFSATGKRTLSADHGFIDPVCEASDAGILLYDFGTTSFAVYNGYTRLYRGEAKHPIYAANISESGGYSLIQKSESGRFFVTVYGEDHTERATFQTDRYVLLSLLDDEGGELAVISLAISGGETVCDVRKYNCDSGELIFSYGEQKQVPLGAAFADDGRLCFITDKRAVFLDRSGDTLGKIEFSGAAAFASDGSHVAIYNGSEILVSSFDGETIRKEKVDGTVRSLALANGRVFLLGKGVLTAFDADGGDVAKKEISGDYDTVLAPSEKYPVLCGMNTAALAEW